MGALFRFGSRRDLPARAAGAIGAGIVLTRGLHFFMVQMTRMEVLMNKRLSVAEAKATLSERIREVESGETVVITRHGKPVAALVRAEDAERLERLRAAGPEGGLARLAGGWEGSEELAAVLSESRRRGMRTPPVLD
jgi:prevent-host-death family protein